MSPSRISAFFFAVFLSAACAQTTDDADPGSAESEVGATATITFDASFEHRVAGALQPGRTVRVEYDAERLTTCRGEQGGVPQWSITGFYKIDGGEVRTFPAGGLALEQGSPTIHLDRAGELEIWFQNTNRWGCNAYDSAFGENYRFSVEFPPSADE